MAVLCGMPTIQYSAQRARLSVQLSNFRMMFFFKLNECLYLQHDKNSSADEIANVNFYTVRPEFAVITQNNAVTPRSFKVTDFGTNRKLIYDFLLVINTNLPPILHRFQDIAVDRTEIAILGYPSCV